MAQQIISKEKRKKQQLERAKKIEEAKKERDKKNREYYNKIILLAPHEQIEIILSDKRHVFYFYVPVILKLIEKEEVNTEDLNKLLTILQQMKRTPFNKKLINKISRNIQKRSKVL